MTFRILSKVQAAYCQELLDKVADVRLAIIDRAHIDHIADRPRGLEPTATKTMQRIDTETQEALKDLNQQIERLGSGWIHVSGEQGVKYAQSLFGKYYILMAVGGFYQLFPPNSANQSQDER